MPKCRTPQGEVPVLKDDKYWENQKKIGKWKRELRLFFRDDIQSENAMFNRVGIANVVSEPTQREDVYILLDEKHVLKLPQLHHYQRTLPKAKNGNSRCVLQLEVQIGRGYNGICDWANYTITSKCQWTGTVMEDYRELIMRLKKYIFKTESKNQEVVDAKFLFEALGENGMSKKTVLVQKNTLREENPSMTKGGVELPGAAEVTRGGVWKYYDGGNGTYHTNKDREIQLPEAKEPPRKATAFVCHRPNVIKATQNSAKNHRGVQVLGSIQCSSNPQERMKRHYPQVCKGVLDGSIQADYLVVPGDFPVENICDEIRIIVDESGIYEEVDAREALKEKGAVHVIGSLKQRETISSVISEHWRMSQPPDHAYADPNTHLGVPFQLVKVEGDQIYHLLNRLPISAQHLLAEADLVGGYPTYLNRSLRWILDF